MQIEQVTIDMRCIRTGKTKELYTDGHQNRVVTEHLLRRRFTGAGDVGEVLLVGSPDVNASQLSCSLRLVVLSRAEVNAGHRSCSARWKRRRFALDSSRVALSSYTTFGGCGWLVVEHEVAGRFHCFVVAVVVSYQDARESGNTALSSPCWDLLATMYRVVNYHSSWARQRQVELFDASDSRDARASGNTALSSPCWDLLATMRRVVKYYSSWARQRQVELFDASGIRV
ncbi:MATH domain and coiled-coil domain-containing protein [Dorcoceras hygrometricum]|uniref:MATH domain and coiled-coil domain-containing protein n=1 Tax=Dorcoceras hygrometricum TaxID=472368 RepID=A0A2Z7AYH5_9LAMI|nr:MATH domain and coiled-coil domain-containing protein [Dorcoceras hygrometricum]